MFLFPDLSIDFQLVPGYLSLFGGVTGDVVKNTIQDFSEQNAYLRNFYGLSNTREKYNAFRGIRGSVSSSRGVRQGGVSGKIRSVRVELGGSGTVKQKKES